MHGEVCLSLMTSVEIIFIFPIELQISCVNSIYFSLEYATGSLPSNHLGLLTTLHLDAVQDILGMGADVIVRLWI